MSRKAQIHGQAILAHALSWACRMGIFMPSHTPVRIDCYKKRVHWELLGWDKAALGAKELRLSGGHPQG